MSKTQDYISQDRGYIYNQGGRLSSQAQERLDESRQGKLFYRSYGDEAYDPLIGGRGGYSPEEAAAIQDSEGLNGLLPPDSSYDSNFLSGDETSAINGNPQSRERYYNPDQSNDLQNTSASFQRSARGNLRSTLNDSIDPNALSISKDYTGGVDSTLNGADSRVRGAADPNRIRQDPGYGGRVRMTPQEQQDIVTGAGISAGTGYRAAAGDLDRQSRAAGLDPVGASAQRERLLRQGAGEASDAETQARIQASNAAYGREKDIESGRRAGETAAAQIGSGNELALSGQRLSAQDRMEAMRMSGAQDVSNREMRAASESGQADIAGEQAINAQGRNVDQFNQSLGTQLATGEEQDAAERARALAENRQRTSMYNSDTRFQRGAAVNSEASRRAQAVADQRRADQREGRAYLVHQGDQQNANETANSGQQLGIYGAQAGLSQNNTQQQFAEDNKPKTWEKIVGAATGVLSAATGGTGQGYSGASRNSTTTLQQPSLNGGYAGSTNAPSGYATPNNWGSPQAHGGVVDKPTYALIGEQGPEAVIPLDPQPDGSYGRTSAQASPQVKRPGRFMYNQAA